MAVENIGAAIAEIKARTGWTWAQVGEHLGTTGEYARKLATKPTSSGAGRALASNVADFQRTGAAQSPVQRAQRVRQRGGAPSAPAPVRVAPSTRRAFNVQRSVFRGATRDGWVVQVTVPSRKTKSGDREDARHAIIGATRRAAQGRRRVAFRVTVKVSGNVVRHVEIGQHGGYDASRALARMRDEGDDPLAWLAAQTAGNRSTGGSNGEFDAGDVLSVEIIALP